LQDGRSSQTVDPECISNYTCPFENQENDMPFPASAIGQKFASSERHISTRQLLAYAAGLGASDNLYLDDASPTGLEGLPFFCVTPEWPVTLSGRKPLSTTLSDVEANRAVHATQDTRFYRAFRPGETLITEGHLVSARGTRAGALSVTKFVTKEKASGELVCSSWSTTIYRDVEFVGDPVKPLENAPPPPASIPLDDNAKVEIISIPREMPLVYTECADIWNPIHSEREVALAAGLPDIILHGTATWALAGLTILRAYVDGKPGRLKRHSGRFTGMVIPGTEIIIRHQPSKADPGIIFYEVLAADGTTVIDNGFSVISS
jgi:acyl dehydratase